MNLPLRIGITAACALAGLFFLPLLLLAAFLAYTIYDDISTAPKRREQERRMEEARKEAERQEEEDRNAPVSVEDVRLSCDSPAETAFLDAMVEAYELETSAGAVAGGDGLKLRNQVPMVERKREIGGRFTTTVIEPKYWADFLIDDDLVVEIDGYAYHSSDKAVARDRQRDADMEAEGYRVLRIPAKTVFNAPREAVRRVVEMRQRSAEPISVGADMPVDL